LIPCGQTLPSLHFPADPLAQATTHDPIQIIGRNPRHFLGKHGDALPVAAWQPCQVAAPEHALRAKRIVNTTQMRVKPPVRIRIRGVKRETTHLYSDIGVLGERQHLIEMVERIIVLAFSEPKMVNDELKSRVTLGNSVYQIHILVQRK